MTPAREQQIRSLLEPHEGIDWTDWRYMAASDLLEELDRVREQRDHGPSDAHDCLIGVWKALGSPDGVPPCNYGDAVKRIVAERDSGRSELAAFRAAWGCSTEWPHRAISGRPDGSVIFDHGERQWCLGAQETFAQAAAMRAALEEVLRLRGCGPYVVKATMAAIAPSAGKRLLAWVKAAKQVFSDIDNYMRQGRLYCNVQQVGAAVNVLLSHYERIDGNVEPEVEP